MTTMKRNYYEEEMFEGEYDISADAAYSEWAYERDREDRKIMEQSYLSGEMAVSDWDLRYPDWSFDNYIPGLPF